MAHSHLLDVLLAIARHQGHDIDLLAELVEAIRPSSRRPQDASARVKHLIALLEQDQGLRAGLADYLRRLTSGMRFHRTFTDAGIPGGAFWRELKRRLVYKVLPPQPEEGTSDHLLVNVFFRERDAEWVDCLDEQDLVRLLDLLELLNDEGSIRWHVEELVFALQVLGLRAAGKAFEDEVMRMVPTYENLDNPFVALADEMDDHIARVRLGERSRDHQDEGYRHVLLLLGQCRTFIERAYANTEQLGMGFSANQQLIILERLLDRMEQVLGLLVIDPDRAQRSKQVQLLRELVRLSAGSTHVLGFIDRSTQVVAREITGHAGRAGEHYITSTSGEYGHMLRTALGGGALVALACVLKAWAGTLEASPFGHAMLYSLNYAWAFIGIYLLHLTLATKQPAMTAATIAATLDEGRQAPSAERYAALVDLLARVWRSQFIAFVGNVVMAFPVAVGLAYGWNTLFGPELFAHKAGKMIHELDPFRSLAIPHAALAGVFLFLSGIIAGSVSNRSKHARVPQRIAAHPVLKLLLPVKRRQALAAYYEANAGGIISNFWFAVFMGSVGMVGAFFGLPLDIRHITFAAGNLGLGLVGMDWHVTPAMVIVPVSGIGLIGLFNFLVSFGLSMVLALRSRGVAFGEVMPIAGAAWQHFKRHPWVFFFPPVRK
jgi:site-specific recombinase